MRICFLTEMGWTGKVPINHPNMRAEMAWMFALNADHFNIMNYSQISGYDWVMLILPKGGVSLNVEGIKLNNIPNRFSQLYAMSFVEDIKKQNKKVAFIQEGPTSYVNDMSISDQFNFYNTIAEVDIIFAHNEYDTNWYKGLFPGKCVSTIPTLMIEDSIQSVIPSPENRAIIGGGMCRWYGGFQSYLVANEFDCPIHVHTSHCTQPGEEQVPNLYVIPRLTWVEWIKMLSTFKYAVHLMPTVAAGTFSLNCAYFGIPCIGNIRVDTQRKCFPELSVEAEDVKGARQLARRLKESHEFYKRCSTSAKIFYNTYYNLDIWQNKMYSELK
jgi:hypothetical protein